MTGKELLRMWLIEKQGQKITEKDMQIDLYFYQQQFGKHYLPDSLSRYFRMVRAEGLLGFEIVEVEGKYKTWLVRHIVDWSLF